MHFTSLAKKLTALFILFFMSAHLALAVEKYNFDFKIIGIDGEALNNVTILATRLQEQHAHLSTISLETLRTDIKKALEPYGYFKANVLVQPILKENRPVINIVIEKGQPLKITAIDTRLSGDGKENTLLTAYLAHLPIQVGDIFQVSSYENTKAQFFQIANNEGYIKAFYQKAQVLIDLRTYRATLILHLDTGKRYYFGRTHFNKSPYATHFLQRFLNYQAGDPFSNQKILLLEQQMATSGYFKQITLMPDFTHIENDQVPMQATIIPPNKRRYVLGAGYGSFTGPRLTATGNFRRLTDTGHHLDVNLRLSSVLSGLSAKYVIPGHDPLNENWLLGITHQRFLPGDDESTSENIFAGYSKKKDALQFDASINLLTERYQEVNVPARRSNLFYPKATISFTEADDLLNPRHGKYFSFTGQGTVQQFLSTTSFLQLDGKAKYIMSPTASSRLIARGELGYTVVHDLNELPLSMRFFAGGLNTIRGFKESSIGPGRYLEVASLEFQHKIVGDWSGALFYDTGIADDHLNTAFNKGAGVGIIYHSIIGNIKLYVARAISKKDKPYDIEISIGPDF